MKATIFEVKEAHSGTSAGEVKKAKKLFFAAVENGEFYDPGYVGIQFEDNNCRIKATFWDVERYSIIGAKYIK